MLTTYVSKKKEIRQEEKKLTYGPRDVVNVSWACSVFVAHHPGLLHPVSTPWAVAHSGGRGCQSSWVSIPGAGVPFGCGQSSSLVAQSLSPIHCHCPPFIISSLVHCHCPLCIVIVLCALSLSSMHHYCPPCIIIVPHSAPALFHPRDGWCVICQPWCLGWVVLGSVGPFPVIWVCWCQCHELAPTIHPMSRGSQAWGWVLCHLLWLGCAAAISCILGVLVVVGHIVDFTHC